MASMLIEHGYVIPVEGEPEVIVDGALGVIDDRIVAVGPHDEVRARLGSADVVLDATGCAVIPGLVNTHAHLVGSFNKAITEDVPRGCMGFVDVAGPLQERHVHENDVYPAVLAHAAEMLRTGITCVNENWWFEAEAGRCLRDLGLRGVLGPLIREVEFAQLALGHTEREWREDLAKASFDQAAEVIDHWHGAAQGRITCRLAPFSADTCSEALLHRCLELADRLGLGFHVHLSHIPGETEAMATLYGKTSTEFLFELGLLDERFVGAHGVFLSPSDIETMAAAGAHLSHTAYLVGKRGYFPPMGPIYEAGVSVSLGSDWCSNDLFKTMRSAIILARQHSGDVFVTDARRVLAMATLGGARALGLADQIGSLVPGKKADIAIVDMTTPWCTPIRTENLVANLVYNANGSDVKHVVVDGRLVVRDSRLTMMDEGELLREAQVAAERVWGRATTLLDKLDPSRQGARTR